VALIDASAFYDPVMIGVDNFGEVMVGNYLWRHISTERGDLRPDF
jgi:hypothetical protein